ncbi:hypothetical protein HPB52_019201 [Rhipicephalus sanguineus]|uniref:CCHC-type domain-containing protein n=1 Tax=Rhipicephalus sanguineus TaxID=34632 RepID=A0A9D4TBF9_RHISA|nr:hypothetical protein HPB52_019201 [Rhipicephalus sanguineus]
MAMEAAKKSAAEARGSDFAVSDVHKVQAEYLKTSKSCFRCGSPKHISEECPHVDAFCFNCDKKGRIERACRSGGKTWSRKKPEKNNVKMLTVASRKASTISLNGVSTAKLDPVTVQMTIDGVLLNMELDTGAAVSVMSTTQFRQLFPSAVLEPSTVKLRTYTGALVRPQGVPSVNVQHVEHPVRLPLYVVDHLYLAGSGCTPSGWSGRKSGT